MINIPKIENYALKNQAAKREYSKQIVLQNNDNETQSTYSKQAFSFKVLACQIKAMAIQVLSVRTKSKNVA